jgi:signal transduction histidine kinase
MHGVLGMLDLMLREENLSESATSYAQNAASSSRTLLRLLDDILDIAKIEKGLLNLTDSEFDPRALAEDLVRLFQAEIAQSGVKVAVRIAEGVPRMIVSDEFRFRQILVNLVSNSIKFTQHGEITVRMSVVGVPTWDMGAGGALRLTVEDTGIGIQPGDIPRIFEPFARLDTGALGARGGSGLGLPIVREICRLMGGSISVESEPGVGTCVSVGIPLSGISAAAGWKAGGGQLPADGPEPWGVDRSGGGGQ